MKKYKKMIVFFLILVFIGIIFLINGYNRCKEYGQNEKNILLGALSYYVGVYDTVDLNYKNVLDFSKDEKGNISGWVYTFDEKRILIEQKRIYYFVLNEEAIQTYNNFKSIEEDESSVTDITDVRINGNIVTLDTNFDKTKKIEDMFESLETKSDGKDFFIVLD